MAQHARDVILRDAADATLRMRAEVRIEALKIGGGAFAPAGAKACRTSRCVERLRAIRR
jgi:hypothetical protein